MKVPQKNLHIVILLAFLVLVGVIVSPVCAGYQLTAQVGTGAATWVSWGQSTGLTYDASTNGMAMRSLNWDLTIGTTVDYTIWYGNGSTVSGQLIYTPVGLQDPVFGAGYKHTQVSMGGVSSGYDYFGDANIGRFDIASYAKNETSSGVYQNGLIVYDSVFGLSDMKCVAFYPTSNAGDSVIYKVSWTSNNPIKAGTYISKRSALAGDVSKSILDIAWEWINLAISLAGAVKDFVLGLYTWIKFLTIDNLLLVVALWIAVTMAYSAISTRDIFKFYTKFFKLQKTFLNFVTEMWNYFIQIISFFRDIFRL
jgi:hypothetical protein